MKVALIGAGNVGFHLAKRLVKKKIALLQIYSRTLKKAQSLGEAIGVPYTNDLSSITKKADLYIIAVKDDAIENVIKALAKNKGMKKKLIVHTSGAVPSSIVAPYFDDYGVFYPLQTFSVEKKAYFKKIPICICSNDTESLLKLEQLARKLSKKVYDINDEQRSVLHVAAVFVNNFTNYFFHIGATICEQEAIDFALLKPLIEETVHKIKNSTPKEMQTGPARRNDKKTLNRHQAYLQRYPSYQKLYDILSNEISALYAH